MWPTTASLLQGDDRRLRHGCPSRFGDVLGLTERQNGFDDPRQFGEHRFAALLDRDRAHRIKRQPDRSLLNRLDRNLGREQLAKRSQGLPLPLPYWLKIERKDNVITSYTSQGRHQLVAHRQLGLRQFAAHRLCRHPCLKRKCDAQYRHLRQPVLHRRDRRPRDNPGCARRHARLGLEQGRHPALAAVLRRHRL